MDTVEVLHRGMEHLRAIVARLRGTGFTRFIRLTVLLQRPFESSESAFVSAVKN